MVYIEKYVKNDIIMKGFLCKMLQRSSEMERNFFTEVKTYNWIRVILFANALICTIGYFSAESFLNGLNPWQKSFHEDNVSIQQIFYTVFAFVFFVIGSKIPQVGRGRLSICGQMLELSFKGRKCRVWVNGRELSITHPGTGGARSSYVYEKMNIEDTIEINWNSLDQFYIKYNKKAIVWNGKIDYHVLQELEVAKQQRETVSATKTEQPMSLARYTLKAIAGVKAGQSWKLDAPLRIGRNPEACQIVFEQNTQGVSRMHCEVGVRNGKAYLKDLGATYGTMLSNGTMVKDYAEYELTENMTFTMGTKESFMVVKE